MYYVIFRNNIVLEKKELPLKIDNKFIAYIGDIQYYQGGDFEYAKIRALNNSLFADYVINHRSEFLEYVIGNAVSNMLINNYIDKKLING